MVAPLANERRCRDRGRVRYDLATDEAILGTFYSGADPDSDGGTFRVLHGDRLACERPTLHVTSWRLQHCSTSFTGNLACAHLLQVSPGLWSVTAVACPLHTRRELEYHKIN